MVQLIMRMKDLQPLLDLQVNDELGSGSFGRVYKADTKQGEIAVKTLKKETLATLTPSQINMAINQFYDEAYLLAQLNHPNILGLEIMISDFQDGLPGMATEFMSRGSLLTCIMGDARLRTWGSLLNIAQQVADAMAYLHSNGVVHFDLKCSNILVDYDISGPNQLICKIADFGLAMVKNYPPPYTGVLPIDGQRGTLMYMAPEVIRANDTKWKTLVTEKVDVFSFGILMWVLLMAEEPYAGKTVEEIESHVRGGGRPKLPDSCNWRWKGLMEDCWQTSARLRPSFEEISLRLHEIQIQYMKKLGLCEKSN